MRGNIMKNKTKFKAVTLIVTAFIVGMFFTRCGGGGGSGKAQQKLTPNDLIFAEVSGENPENPIVALATTKDTSEAVGVLAERDTVGNPSKVTGAVYISKQGTAAILESGPDGLPASFIDSSGKKATFTNYTNSTVDISVFDANENLIAGPKTVSVDTSTMAEIKQLFSSISFDPTAGSSQALVKTNAFTLPTWVKPALQWASVGFSFAGCGVGIFFVDIPGAAATCVSAVINLTAKVTGSELLEIGTTGLSGDLCTSLIGATFLFNCLAALADGAASLIPSPTPTPTPTPTFIPCPLLAECLFCGNISNCPHSCPIPGGSARFLCSFSTFQNGGAELICAFDPSQCS
jgi:hypothetical protein